MEVASVAVENLDVMAYREFCYRWTCKCGCENRVGEISRGEYNVCRACKLGIKINVIVYDNGCVTRIG